MDPTWSSYSGSEAKIWNDRTLEEGMNYRLLKSPQTLIPYYLVLIQYYVCRDGPLLSSGENAFGVTCATYQTHHKIHSKTTSTLVYILSWLLLASIKPQIALYYHWVTWKFFRSEIMTAEALQEVGWREYFI